MARPAKTNLDYFPLDVNFSQDPKIMAISAEFGLPGEYFILQLYSHIYRTKGYFITWNKLNKPIFQRYFKDHFSAEQIDSIIEHAVEYELFDRELFEQHQVLTSTAIQSRYVTATEQRVVDYDSLEYWLIDWKSVNGSKRRKSMKVNNPGNTTKEIIEKESIE